MKHFKIYLLNKATSRISTTYIFVKKMLKILTLKFNKQSKNDKKFDISSKFQHWKFNKNKLSTSLIKFLFFQKIGDHYNMKNINETP